MEHSERERILGAVESDLRLRRLYEEHCRLDAQVASYERRPFLTTPEQTEVKRLKVRKLRGLDEMMAVVRRV